MHLTSWYTSSIQFWKRDHGPNHTQGNLHQLNGIYQMRCRNNRLHRYPKRNDARKCFLVLIIIAAFVLQTKEECMYLSNMPKYVDLSNMSYATDLSTTNASETHLLEHRLHNSISKTTYHTIDKIPIFISQVNFTQMIPSYRFYLFSD